LQSTSGGHIIRDPEKETSCTRSLLHSSHAFAETSYGESPSFVYHERTEKNSISVDSAEYIRSVQELMDAAYASVRAHPEEGFDNYQGILETSRIK
jgi:hypothetical protein